jgi:hypothetical protein
VSIPLPSVSSGSKEFKSECDKYDGSEETGGLCNGWVTKNSTCMRRDDDIAKRCDGYGRIKPA